MRWGFFFVDPRLSWVSSRAVPWNDLWDLIWDGLGTIPGSMSSGTVVTWHIGPEPLCTTYITSRNL